MTGLRVASLPAIALILVGGVLGVQLANGGGAYSPLTPADPCAVRRAPSPSPGIEGLTERLVLIGLDKAACTLGVTREALTLRLAGSSPITNREVDAIHQGLLAAVAQLDRRGQLPAVSSLLGEALDQSDLNGLIKTLIGAIPDSVVDAALKTDDVLTHVIDDLDLRQLLTNLHDPDALQGQLQAAVTKAVAESLVDRVRDLL